MNAEAGTGQLLLTYRGTVYPQHLDHMDHMNIQYYMAKFDEVVWNLFHRIGLTPSYLRAEHRDRAARREPPRARPGGDRRARPRTRRRLSGGVR